MADSVMVRAAIGLGVVGAAVASARLAWRIQRRGLGTAPLVLDGVPDRLVLFSDAACARCDEARATLETTGRPFREIAYDTEPETMGAVGVTAVPLIVARRADGAEAGRIVGKVSPRRLRRLLDSAGL